MSDSCAITRLSFAGRWPVRGLQLRGSTQQLCVSTASFLGAAKGSVPLASTLGKTARHHRPFGLSGAEHCPHWPDTGEGPLDSECTPKWMVRTLTGGRPVPPLPDPRDATKGRQVGSAGGVAASLPPGVCLKRHPPHERRPPSIPAPRASAGLTLNLSWPWNQRKVVNPRLSKGPNL